MTDPQVEANQAAAAVRLAVLRALAGLKGKDDPVCPLTLADKIAADFEGRYFAPFNGPHYSAELASLRKALSISQNSAV